MHSSRILLSAAELNDAELVNASRAGNRDAFRQIVSRYQSLVCSLAYSATGSISRSEDLAQETFVTAWRQLCALREPAHLRPWLCGIARNLTHNALRRAAHEPVQLAGPLESTDDLPAPEPSPPQQAISREEEAILWRALAEIPALYREPLVLYYREHQSVEAVARALDLSEEAVRQRLSRGRVQLQAQVLAFVEGTLERTKPDPAFTLNVVAALPLLATASGAVATTSIAAKGGASTKTAIAVGISSTVMTAGLIAFFSMIGFVIFVGGCVGYIMSRACERSREQRHHVTRFWRIVALGFAVFVLPGLAAVHSDASSALGPTLHRGLVSWLALIHVLVPAAVIVWAWRWLRASRHPGVGASEGESNSNKRFLVWLGGGMAVPAVFFIFFLGSFFFHPTLSGQRISETEARRIIAERSDATFELQLHRGEPNTLRIRLPEKRRVALWIRADESTLPLLAEHGRSYKSHEFHESPLAFRWVFLLSCFLAPAGATILVRRPWRHDPAGEAVNPGCREKTAAKTFAICVALAMLAVSVLLGLLTRWNVQAVSEAEMKNIIAERKDAEFTVFEYKDGSKRLVVTLRGEGKPRLYAAVAEESILSMLVERGIVYRTAAQGPNFTYRDPVPSVSLVSIALLVTGAVVLLWWTRRKAP